MGGNLPRGSSESRLQRSGHVEAIPQKHVTTCVYLPIFIRTKQVGPASLLRGVARSRVDRAGRDTADA